jgi:hypothetical protein
VTNTLDTLDQAEMAKARALDDLREASAAADRLASEQFAQLRAKRAAWAHKVLAEKGPDLAAAERKAYRAFAQAAVSGDARGGFLDWLTARAALNIATDRLIAAKSILGTTADTDNSYPIRDTPSFSVECDRALAAEASARYTAMQEELQREINSIDRL